MTPFWGFSQVPVVGEKYDINSDKILYTVGYTHLDSEYEWDYKTTINEYLKNTMTENYDLFEKYPHYKFSFTGARRYKLMKEYYPELYKKIQYYIDRNRWFVAGSSVDEAEVNISSPESVLRQILYGNAYFKKDFGKESVDYMLPDCFGFVASLPTVLHHAGLKGFSTQKLTVPSLRPAIPLPFNIGMWKGPDGKGLVSVLDATDYDGDVLPRLDIDPYWVKRVNDDDRKYGINFGYRYYGNGDMGGGIRERDIVNLKGSMNNPDSKLKVVLTSTDQMFRDITPEIKNKLPVYSGDLLLTRHSAGSQSSQSYMKRLNRKNEILAQSAEELTVMADFLTGMQYPLDKLNRSWELLLASQMHDVLPGTAIPSAFNLAWNDEFIAQNGFANVLKSAAGRVSSQLNTQVKGRAVVVYNPVARNREDVCTAELAYKSNSGYLKVFDPKGKEVPSQIISREGNKVKLIFLARVPSVGVAVYDVREAASPLKQETSSLNITPNRLENEYYKVTLNDKGDIAGIWDKKLNRELLSEPARLEFLYENPSKEPSWNMFWDDRKNPPFAFMDNDVRIEMVESGPVRVAFEVTRSGQNSTITQLVSLSAGDAGKRLEISNKINWQSTGVSLKASFPFKAENEMATYNLVVGTVERNTNHEKKYEVPSKMWFDLTDKSGKYGVSVLEDCKYGSDKPDDHTLRLTLLYTPSADKCHTWLYQASQDWGIQEVKYGLYSHAGGWSKSEVQKQAEFLNKPLIAFEAPKHTGKLKKEFSFLKISSPSVGLMALKKVENSDYYVVRVNELSGKDLKNISLTFPDKIAGAYEINGQEQKIGDVKVLGNRLIIDLSHYTIRSFAVKMNSKNEVKTHQVTVALPFNEDVMSHDNNRSDGTFYKKPYDPTRHGNLYGYPAEEIPDEIVSDGISFKMGSREDLQNNVVRCAGQEIDLPQGDFNKLYILASAYQDLSDDFTVDGEKVKISISKWYGFMGQHYDRQFEVDGYTVYDVKPPFVKKDDIAWFASHRHFSYPSANMAYEYSYIFKYAIDIDKNAKKIVLPDNPMIRVFAITLAGDQTDNTRMLQPLHDDFRDNPPYKLRPGKHVQLK